VGWDAVTTKQPPPGAWVEYRYGADVRGWHLGCGGTFYADIGQCAKGYSVTLNMHVLTTGQNANDLKRVAERAIVDRVRNMLPAYKVIHARVKNGDDKKWLNLR
jgi:hypothetical protein